MTTPEPTADAPAVLPYEPVADRPGTAAGWAVALLFFPYGPFVYLAKLRALSTGRAVAFVAVSLAVNLGVVSVLIDTTAEPEQRWPVLTLAGADVGRVQLRVRPHALRHR